MNVFKSGGKLSEMVASILFRVILCKSGEVGIIFSVTSVSLFMWLLPRQNRSCFLYEKVSRGFNVYIADGDKAVRDFCKKRAEIIRCRSKGVRYFEEMEGREISEERFMECLAIDFPNFKITKSNLTHPTSQFVISFYALILRHVIELNEPEEIWNLTEDQRAYMRQNPEAATFSQHVWTNNLHAAVKYVFSQLSQNGTEFVYSDILFPEITPRRSFVFMALMLNFYWYTNDFAVGLNDDMTACVNEGMLIRDLKTEREKLINQIKEHEDQRSQYAELFKEIKGYIKKSSDSNDEQENIMKELIAKEMAILKDVEKVAEEEQALQEVHTKLQNEEKYLESLIVSNQNQVIDVHQKNLKKKEECVKKMKMLEEQAKLASNKLTRSTKVLEHQQKLHYYLKEEKFLPDSTGKHKGFESLVENINILAEKKKKLSEEELTLTGKVSEAEEAIPRQDSEYAHFESEQQKIYAVAKDKTSILNGHIDDQKKAYSQLFIQMKKDAEEMEQFEPVSEDMNRNCEEMEEKMKSFDMENKDRYLSYVKEMTAALNSIQAFFNEDKNFF